RFARDSERLRADRRDTANARTGDGAENDDLLERRSFLSLRGRDAERGHDRRRQNTKLGAERLLRLTQRSSNGPSKQPLHHIPPPLTDAVTGDDTIVATRTASRYGCR